MKTFGHPTQLQMDLLVINPQTVVPSNLNGELGLSGAGHLHEGKALAVTILVHWHRNPTDGSELLESRSHDGLGGLRNEISGED